MKEYIRKMHQTLASSLLNVYKTIVPNKAQDDNPADKIGNLIRANYKRWKQRYAKEAETNARQFVNKIDEQSQKQMAANMKKLGMTVDYNLTPQLKKVLRDAVSTNTELIKTIPEYYHDKVTDIVTKAAENGRDESYLVDKLQEAELATENRAALIARDQINRVTNQVAIARSQSLGITKGIWIHVPGVHSSRITHEAMDGQEFELDQGLYDDDVGDYVKPGELIYCNCTYQPVVPGFEEDDVLGH